MPRPIHSYLGAVQLTEDMWRLGEDVLWPPIRVLYPGYRRPPVMAQKIWARPNSLQRKTAGESLTLCLVWSHLFWLKRRDHQPKKNKTQAQSVPNLSPTLMATGKQAFEAYRSTIAPPRNTARHTPGPPATTPGGSLIPGKCH
jgi:hypothetical protein